MPVRLKLGDSTNPYNQEPMSVRNDQVGFKPKTTKPQPSTTNTSLLGKVTKPIKRFVGKTLDWRKQRKPNVIGSDLLGPSVTRLKKGITEMGKERARWNPFVSKGLWGKVTDEPRVQSPQEGLESAKTIGKGALTAYGLASPGRALFSTLAGGGLGGLTTGIQNKLAGRPFGEDLGKGITKGAGQGLARSGTTRLTQGLVNHFADTVPFLKPLSSESLKAGLPEATDTLKQGIKKWAQTGGKRLLRNAILETAVETPIWATLTQGEQESFTDALQRETIQNLAMNVAYTGAESFADARTLLPIVKTSIDDAVDSYRQMSPEERQAGFVSIPGGGKTQRPEELLDNIRVAISRGQEEAAKSLYKSAKEDFEDIPTYQKLVDDVEAGHRRVAKELVGAEAKISWDKLKSADIPDEDIVFFKKLRNLQPARDAAWASQHTRKFTSVSFDEIADKADMTPDELWNALGRLPSKEIADKPLKSAQEQYLEEVGREKSFLTRASKTEAAGEEFIKEVKKNPMKYAPHKNKDAANWAIDKIDKDGVDGAVKWAENIKVKDLEKEGDRVTAVGMMSIQKKINDGNPEKAADLANQFDQVLRGGGRMVQAARLWGDIAESPDTMVEHAKQTYKEANERMGKFREVELTDELEQEIRRRSQELFAIRDPEARKEAALEIKSLIAEQIPPSAMEWVDAYRYNNMLSGYANLRNLQSNLTNLFFTRPYEILLETPVDYIRANIFGADRRAYDKSLLDYEKGARNAIPEAIEITKAVWKQEEPVTRPDFSPREAGPDQLALQKRTPGIITGFTRLMEMGDVLIRTPLAGAEYETRVKAGTDEETAAQEAFDAANKVMGRGFRGDTEETRLLLKQIDSTKEWLRSFRDSNIFTKTTIPFVSTSFEFLGQRLQRTPITGPLTTIGAKDQTEQWAKVVGSTLPFILGAYKAAQGETNWTPPKDEEAKNEWYASGKKRWSMQFELPDRLKEEVGKDFVNVPFFYLGHYGLAAAIPAAWHHFAKDAKDAELKKNYEVLAETLFASMRYSTGEIPIRSGLEMLDIFTGQADKSVWENLIFQAEQFVPLSAMQRDVAKMLDPVFRQTDKPLDEWKKSVPWFFSALRGETPSVGPKKELLPYLTPEGEESKRGPLDYLPYSVGTKEPKFAEQFEKTMDIKREDEPFRWYSRELDKLDKKRDEIYFNIDMSEEERQKKLDRLDKEEERLDKQYDELIKNLDVEDSGAVTPGVKAEPTRGPVRTGPRIY